MTVAGLPLAQLRDLAHDWSLVGRATQQEPPGDWYTWLIMAGRGWGKTRTGAAMVRRWDRQGVRIIGVVARTAAEVRDVCVKGPAGILAQYPAHEGRAVYRSSERVVITPSGCRVHLYTADEPDQLRGPQHERMWCDELAAWRYEDAYTQAVLGLRLGTNPRMVITTTPRPTDLVRDIVSQDGVRLTRGSTFENSRHLAPQFIAEMRRRYEGTRTGRQELYAELLTDTPGALWRYDMIDPFRVAAPPRLIRIVVGVDPAITANEDSDSTGIVAVGIGTDRRYYVLEDASGVYSPGEWAAKVREVCDRHQADAVVAETNQGGDMVRHTLRTARVGVRIVEVHASRGKVARAEPIAYLYERGSVSHVGAGLGKLESQLTKWTHGDASPDRLDALVWALTELDTKGAPEAPTLATPIERPREYARHPGRRA